MPKEGCDMQFAGSNVITEGETSATTITVNAIKAAQ